MRALLDALAGKLRSDTLNTLWEMWNVRAYGGYDESAWGWGLRKCSALARRVLECIGRKSEEIDHIMFTVRTDFLGPQTHESPDLKITTPMLSSAKKPSCVAGLKASSSSKVTAVKEAPSATASKATRTSLVFGATFSCRSAFTLWKLFSVKKVAPLLTCRSSLPEAQEPLFL